MAKTINATVQAAIDSKDFAGVLLAKLDFTPELRYTNAFQNIYWDEAGGGELEYVGLGNLASVSVLSESSELSAQTIQMTLSGIPGTAITDVFSTEYIGKPCYLWYATLDKDTYAVTSGQAGPVLIIAGRMDFVDIEFGNTCTITLNATSRLADWERARGGRFNEPYQRNYVDATDNGFDYVQALQNKPLTWGGVNISDPGSAYPPVYHPGCFAEDTKFYLNDGSLCNVQDIQPGDIMLEGGLVLCSHKGNGEIQDWYNYKGVEVSGYHFVLDEGTWKPIKDCEKAIPIDPYKYIYSVSNEHNIMVSENGTVFNDFDMVGPVPIWEAYREEVIKYLNSKTDVIERLSKLKL